jgi:23S rRNA pseudouridine1911/1915/1917 synthase
MSFSGVQPKVLSMGSGVEQPITRRLKSTERKAAKILFVMSSLNTHKTKPDYTDAPEVQALQPLESALLTFNATSGAGVRVDKFLAAQLKDVSRTRIQKWIALGAVRIDDVPVASKLKLCGVETIEVSVLPVEADSAFEPDDVKLDVVSQTAEFLVLNKATNQVVHPGPGNWRGTIMNGLLFHFPDSALLPRAGIVHRLDKDTSGLMVIAKTEKTRAHLVDLLSRHEVQRTYWALVWGLAAKQGKVDKPIGRDPANRLKMAVVQGAKESTSYFTLLADGVLFGKPVSLLEVRLETGRTHQIRVHFQAIGHPLVGDKTYVVGVPTQASAQVLKTFERQALHAKKLAFALPSKSPEPKPETHQFESQLPNDFLTLLQQAGIDTHALQLVGQRASAR